MSVLTVTPNISLPVDSLNNANCWIPCKFYLFFSVDFSSVAVQKHSIYISDGPLYVSVQMFTINYIQNTLNPRNSALKRATLLRTQHFSSKHRNCLRLDNELRKGPIWIPYPAKINCVNAFKMSYFNFCHIKLSTVCIFIQHESVQRRCKSNTRNLSFEKDR